MIWHFIIMSSSYSRGTRIALDLISSDTVQPETVSRYLGQIYQVCGKDISISTHMLSTDSCDWESVVDSDLFFEGVEKINTLEEFCSLILQDRVLRGLDVAKYILSRVSCTHLKLEKLTYFCYTDYLCAYKKQLFKDEIYAFQYGPVVDSVYQECKRYGHDTVRLDLSQAQSIHGTMPESAARSRILFSTDGIEKLQSIDETLRKYGELQTSTLVDITHRKGSPWSRTEDGIYVPITDESILRGHSVEQI